MLADVALFVSANDSTLLDWMLYMKHAEAVVAASKAMRRSRRVIHGKSRLVERSESLSPFHNLVRRESAVILICEQDHLPWDAPGLCLD